MRPLRFARAFRALKIALIRLPLNLRSNRWFVILGRTLYFLSRRESRSYAREVTRHSLASGSSDFRVYRRLLSLGRSNQATDRGNDAILLPNLGRFGNAVREVVCALSVARSLEIGNVYLAGDNVFASTSDIPSPGIHATPAGPKLWIDSTAPTSPPFSRLIRWSRRDYGLDGEDRQVEWASLRSALRVNGEAQDSGIITIHLRGGDVFGTRDVRNYGQPPLSYYEKVLDHSEATKVLIVYQDELNPVFHGLVRMCQERSLVCTTQSSSLRQDIATLMGARTLVAGRGTFLPAIVGLSPHIERVYFFEDKFSLQPPRHGFDMYRVFDATGDYRKTVLTGNWENRPDQRALMTSYPVSQLVLEKAT
jgi:hypothetical protein